jgi:predicted acylesterase/phospholipase RssA
VSIDSASPNAREPAGRKLFPPIVYDGELPVDGGVINNVPVDLMKEFSNSGITVGVDVSPPHELNEIRDYCCRGAVILHAWPVRTGSNLRL